jgi:hypothetical protein
MSTDAAEIAPLMKDVEIAVTVPAPDPSYIPLIVTDTYLFKIHMTQQGHLRTLCSKKHSDYQVFQ